MASDKQREKTGKKHLHRGHRERRGRGEEKRADLKVRTYNRSTYNRNEERGSFVEVLEAEVAELDFYAGFGAEALGKLFGQVDGAMLAAGAAKGNH